MFKHTKKRRLLKVDVKNNNESSMKIRGEYKARKTLLTKTGNFKNINATQEGQILIFDEAVRILPLMRDWIDNKSGLVYREALKDAFQPLITKDSKGREIVTDVLLQKITETMLFMAGSIHSEDGISITTSKTRHKKINGINSKITPNLTFNDTWRFCEVLVSFSNYFSLETKIEHSKGKFNTSIRYTCSLGEKIMDQINTLAMESFYPLPMTECPVDWSMDEHGNVSGGYDTFQYEMIRTKFGGVDYTKYPKNIFDTLNYVQSVPWIVNEKVMLQAEKDLKEPVKTDYVKTIFPDAKLAKWDIDVKAEDCPLNKEEIQKLKAQRLVYQDQAALYNAELGDYNSEVGKYRYLKLAISITKKYIGKTVYFLHNYDFRGRLYPLTIGLTPQGNDAVKSFLLYKNTKPLTEKGLSWCWAYLASLYGDDKITFEDRILRGKELIDTNYLEADEPYQFLSHQLELKKYLKNDSYEPNVRIHLDACNSGSQFTSAITNDLKGCMATNVVPTVNEEGLQERQDAYILVANKSIELAKKMFDETDDNEEKNKIGFIQNLLEKDGRKICKKPVMVSNYGGTAGGRTHILWAMLRTLGVDRKWITNEVATKFSQIIGGSIVGVLNGGKAFEIYIQKMNNIIAKHDLAIRWTTGDGFCVLHSKNKELKPKSVRCLVPGSRRAVSITKKMFSKNLSSSKMRSAISPNYIHSLDAELLRRVAIIMSESGVNDTDWIHDSFGSHPNDTDFLLDVTKEVFIDMMESNPLETLDKELREQCPDNNKALKEMFQVNIPNLGNGKKIDFKAVLKSEWFFS